jgi:hypothetical protein
MAVSIERLLSSKATANSRIPAIIANRKVGDEIAVKTNRSAKNPTSLPHIMIRTIFKAISILTAEPSSIITTLNLENPATVRQD